jgi:hypothetical protein
MAQRGNPRLRGSADFIKESTSLSQDWTITRSRSSTEKGNPIPPATFTRLASGPGGTRPVSKIAEASARPSHADDQTVQHA